MMRIVDSATCIGVRPEDDRALDAATLVSEMDRAGVAEALTTHFGAVRYDASTGNSAVMEICRTQPRLHPVAVVNPTPYIGVAEEVARCVREGCVGFRFLPISQGWSLESETFRLVLEAVSGAGLPLTVELGSSSDATRMARLARGLSVPVILAGVTYGTMGEAVAVLRRQDNLHLEACRLVTPGIVELLASEVGAERLLFGSGAPYWEVTPTLDMIRHADISEESREAILGGNARRIYRLGSGGQP